MCKNKNIKWYLWSINDRVFIPQNIDYYGKLSCVRAPMSAEAFFKSKMDIDIETDHYRLDSEHYIREIHNKIARQYFGYVKDTNNENNT